MHFKDAPPVKYCNLAGIFHFKKIFYTRVPAAEELTVQIEIAIMTHGAGNNIFSVHVTLEIYHF